MENRLLKADAIFTFKNKHSSKMKKSVDQKSTVYGLFRGQWRLYPALPKN
jgi:hypothetical protein